MPTFAPTKQRAVVLDRFIRKPLYIGKVDVPFANGTGFSVTPHAESRKGDMFHLVYCKRSTSVVTNPSNFTGLAAGTFNTNERINIARNTIDLDPASFTWSWTGAADYIGSLLTYRDADGNKQTFQNLNNQNAATFAPTSPVAPTDAYELVIGVVGCTNLRTFTPPAYAIERYDGGGASGPSLCVWDFIAAANGAQPNDVTTLSSADLVGGGVMAYRNKSVTGVGTRF